MLGSPVSGQVGTLQPPRLARPSAVHSGSSPFSPRPPQAARPKAVPVGGEDGSPLQHAELGERPRLQRQWLPRPGPGARPCLGTVGAGLRPLPAAGAEAAPGWRERGCQRGGGRGGQRGAGGGVQHGRLHPPQPGGAGPPAVREPLGGAGAVDPPREPGAPLHPDPHAAPQHPGCPPVAPPGPGAGGAGGGDGAVTQDRSPSPPDRCWVRLTLDRPCPQRCRLTPSSAPSWGLPAAASFPAAAPPGTLWPHNELY